MDELDIFKLIERLEKIENIDLDQRLKYIETQLKYFSFACASMEKQFKNGINIKIDQEVSSILIPLDATLKGLQKEVNSLAILKKILFEELQNETLIGTVKFMAKELHELKCDIHTIKEEGIKKDLHLALTLEGYEMVRKKTKACNQMLEDEKKDDPYDADQSLHDLLNTLTDREKKVLIHRYGLFGEKTKTLNEIGIKFKLSRERIRAVELKALLKCRHPSRRSLVEHITHLQLRKDIIGK